MLISVVNSTLDLKMVYDGWDRHCESIITREIGLRNPEMTAWNTDVYDQLMQMGIEGPIAQEAARRFQDVERAVNWSFDHGQSVRCLCNCSDLEG